MSKKLITLLLVFSALILLPAKSLAANPPSQGNSIYSSPGTPIPADGVTAGTITVNLKDSGGNYVIGDTITLSSSNNNTAAFNNSQTTGSTGNATFTITSTAIGTTKVTLSDNTNVTTFTDWFTVTFYSAALGCSSVPAAPILTAVTSNSNNTATLIWTDSGNPVSNYLVSYGTVSGKYIYGNTNIGPQGTTSFTVGSLSGNKKYYFVVAANNNCGTGGYSNEMSVVVNPTPTPVPTVAPTAEPVATPQSEVTVTSVTETPVETPTPEVAAGGSSMIKTVGIILTAAGFVIIGSLAVILIIAKRKSGRIPPIHPPLSDIPAGSNPPTEGIPPSPPSTTLPPAGENPPQI